MTGTVTIVFQAYRAPKDHIKARILQTVISGIPLMLSLGTRMSDPYLYVVFWAPSLATKGGVELHSPYFLVWTVPTLHTHSIPGRAGFGEGRTGRGTALSL